MDLGPVSFKQMVTDIDGLSPDLVTEKAVHGGRLSGQTMIRRAVIVAESLAGRLRGPANS